MDKNPAANRLNRRSTEILPHFAIVRTEACRGKIPAMLGMRSSQHCFCARLGFLLAACGWIISCDPAIAAAQDISRQREAVPRAILLPPTVVRGAQATLAVVDGAGRLLPGVTVEISGEQAAASSAASPPEKITTDSTGRATFLVPSGTAMLFASIPGRKVAASSQAVADDGSAQSTASVGEPPLLKLTSYPHVLAILDRFEIAGNGFRGLADSNHVQLGGQPCLVVASSPVSMVILPGPHIPIGDITLQIRAAGRDTGPIPVTGVLLDFSGPAEAPAAGGEGKLILHVHGTTEPLAVEVHNSSPEIIQLLHGNLQRVGTSGGEDNIAPVALKFIAAGNYVITARVVAGEASNPHGGN